MLSKKLWVLKKSRKALYRNISSYHFSGVTIKVKLVLVHLHFISPLTVRQGANDNVLSGDARTVPVVGHHTETVLCVLLQPRHAVRLAVYVNILNEKRREGEELVSELRIVRLPLLKKQTRLYFHGCSPTSQCLRTTGKTKTEYVKLVRKGNIYDYLQKKTKTLIALQCSIFIVFHSQQQSDKRRHLGPFQ